MWRPVLPQPRPPLPQPRLLQPIILLMPPQDPTSKHSAVLSEELPQLSSSHLAIAHSPSTVPPSSTSVPPSKDLVPSRTTLAQTLPTPELSMEVSDNVVTRRRSATPLLRLPQRSPSVKLLTSVPAPTQLFNSPSALTDAKKLLSKRSTTLTLTTDRH